ncbi:MAG TPA: hypothetical protein VFN94_00145 [Nitrospiria bacterium]|nr:hypothetical protein [Nitrospiria bacterium]
MYSRTARVGILLVATWCSAAYGNESVRAGDSFPQPKALSAHRSVVATVTKVVSGSVLLRTEDGTLRNVAVTDAARDGMSRLRPGDEVDLILDYGNSVVAIAPPRGTGAYVGDEVTGTVQHGAPPFFDRFNKRITLKTTDGEVQTFELRDAAATKLNGTPQGRMIVLVMDGHHRAFDAYRPLTR